MRERASPTVTRWYEEPFAWLVFALPAAAVLACLVTIVIAVKTADGLVVDDYYKRGLEINKRLVREDAAIAEGLTAGLVIGDRGAFQLELRGRDGFAHPGTVSVTFAHATRGGVDRVLTVEHLGRGLYRGVAGELPAGPWYVEIATPRWRIVERVTVRPTQ